MLCRQSSLNLIDTTCVMFALTIIKLASLWLFDVPSSQTVYPSTSFEMNCYLDKIAYTELSPRINLSVIKKFEYAF